MEKQLHERSSIRWSLNKKLQTSVCLLFVFLLTPGWMLAQTEKFSGAIIDEFERPLIGVSILIKGTSTGTVSDEHGQFSIIAQSGQTLFLFL